MQSIIRKFWWGNVEQKRGMNWVARDKICKLKQHGGMGFKDPIIFNQALLAKQAWRLLKYPNTLVANGLHAKYYLSHEFTKAKFGRSHSYI